MQCARCGAQLRSQNKFCPVCGAPVPRRSTNGSARPSSTAAFPAVAAPAPPPAQPAERGGSGVLIAVVAVAVAAVAVVAVALVFAWRGSASSSGSHDVVYYGQADAMTVSAVTLIVPCDSSNEPIEEYAVVIKPADTASEDALGRITELEVEGTSGFTVGNFGGVEDGEFVLNIEDHRSGRTRNVLVSYDVDNVDAPAELRAEEQGAADNNADNPSLLERLLP